MNKRIAISFIVIALTIAGGFLILQINNSSLRDGRRLLVTEQSPYRVEKINIESNTTYSILMEQAGIEANLSAEILATTKPVYDLAQIRVGRTLDLYFDKKTNALVKLIYQIDTENEVHIIAEKLPPLPPTTPSPSSGRRGTSPTESAISPPFEGAEEKISPPFEGGVRGGLWTAEKIPIPYEVKEKIVSGTLKTSLYEWALENQVDERAIIDFANALQWSIDFANDPQPGDTFKFIYQERYRDGKYIMPATMLAGKYLNVDKKHLAFYFEENADNKGYFDAEGNSLQKMFLKAPVEYKYISSGYTSGKRYVQAFNVSTGHRAVDYATAPGTPIRSVGNGTITFAGWNGSYGNFVSIRHNGTFSTNYAHQSRIAVKRGQKVSQGQTIGYVGSTGFSTGPHLHYEMVKNGVKVNPLLEVLPPGKPITNENKQRFFNDIKKYKTVLE